MTEQGAPHERGAKGEPKVDTPKGTMSRVQNSCEAIMVVEKHTTVRGKWQVHKTPPFPPCFGRLCFSFLQDLRPP